MAQEQDDRLQFRARDVSSGAMEVWDRLCERMEITWQHDLQKDPHPGMYEDYCEMAIQCGTGPAPCPAAVCLLEVQTRVGFAQCNWSVLILMIRLKHVIGRF